MTHDIFCPHMDVVQTSALLNLYSRSRFRRTQNHILASTELQKQTLQKSFRKTYGLNLPLPCNVFTMCALQTDLMGDVNHGSDSILFLGLKKPPKHIGFQSVAMVSLSKRAHVKAWLPKLSPIQSMLSQGVGHLLCANWVLSYTLTQLESRGNVRGILNNVVRDVELLMHKQQNDCVVRGLRLVATGRLGKRKKAMSQQISRAIGKVPLSKLSSKVDYCAGTAHTKLGCVGLKVWVCYG